uniref:Uncharacterized protein n=1 Tax=Anopheles arabiensis TaxID=7173 RepID=A0A182IDI9_ANOAR
RGNITTLHVRKGFCLKPGHRDGWFLTKSGNVCQYINVVAQENVTSLKIIARKLSNSTHCFDYPFTSKLINMHRGNLRSFEETEVQIDLQDVKCKLVAVPLPKDNEFDFVPITLFSSNIYKGHWPLANNLITLFVKKYVDVYGPQFISSNVHNFTHIFEERGNITTLHVRKGFCLKPGHRDGWFLTKSENVCQYINVVAQENVTSLKIIARKLSNSTHCFDFPFTSKLINLHRGNLRSFEETEVQIDLQDVK